MAPAAVAAVAVPEEEAAVLAVVVVPEAAAVLEGEAVAAVPEEEVAPAAVAVPEAVVVPEEEEAVLAAVVVPEAAAVAVLAVLQPGDGVAEAVGSGRGVARRGRQILLPVAPTHLRLRRILR